MQEIFSKACVCGVVRHSRLQNTPAHTGDSQGGRKPLREVKAAELSGDVTRCKDHAVLLPLQHRAAHGCINNADSCFMSGLCNAVKQSYD